MKAALRQWLERFRQQPTSVHLALAGILLLLFVMLISEPQQPLPGESSEQTQTTAAEATAVVENGSSATGRTAQEDTPQASTTPPLNRQADTSGPIELRPLPIPAAPLPQSGPARQDTQQAAASNRLPKLVIILDDIGNNAQAGERALALPGAITYAVLPYTPYGAQLAEQAYQHQRDVMLHAPMSNLAGMDPGPGSLSMDMDETRLRETLRQAIADIPHVIGVNNHTGSELTSHRQPMQWVMQELKQHQLFFVDSLTSNNSVAGDVAQEYHIPVLKRHVFLDNITEPEAIDAEFQHALDIARSNGYAVAIGHPYPATLDYLEKALPTLKQQGIDLVSAGTLLSWMHR